MLGPIPFLGPWGVITYSVGLDLCHRSPTVFWWDKVLVVTPPGGKFVLGPKNTKRFPGERLLEKERGNTRCGRQNLFARFHNLDDSGVE